MKSRTSLLLTALLVACTVAGFAQSSITYKITTFSFPGAVSTTATGINNNNVIVGSYVDSNNVTHGYRLTGSTFQTIDFRGAAETEVLGINDNGYVVGDYRLTANDFPHGFEMSPGGVENKIDFPGATSTIATGVNNSQEIVGYYNNAQGFILQNGTYKTFDAPQQSGTTPDTQINGINNFGEFVGQVFSFDDWRGFWVTGGTSDVDFLEPEQSTDNFVNGINGHHDIVGCSSLMQGSAGFIVLSPEANEGSESTEKFPTPQSIGSITGGGCANSINYARVIVGTVHTAQSKAYMAVPQASITITVTSPKNGATVSNPVQVTASATGSHPISQMQVWVNFKEVFHVSGSSINTSLTLPAGTDRFVIQAVDSTGATAKVTETITVN